MLEVSIPSPPGQTFTTLAALVFTKKFVEEVPVPFIVVTLITPEEAAAGTTAVIFEEESTVNVAGELLNRTEVAPVKFVPLITMEAPTTPLKGEKELMVGLEDKNVKPVFETVPTLFVTLTLPDEPDPTTAFILTDVSETILKDAAGVPPKLTAVTLLKLLP